MNVLSLLTPKEKVAYLYDTNTLRQGLEKLRCHGYTAIPVLREDGTFAGCVSEGDFLWYMVSCGEGELRALEHYHMTDIMRADWNPAAHIDISIEELLHRSVNQNFIPIVDGRNCFCGIITRKDIIQAICRRQRELEK